MALGESAGQIAKVYAYRMQITVTISDDIAEQLIPRGADAGEVLLKLSGLRAYSEGRISERTLQAMLGFGSIFELHEFLKQHLGDEGPDTIESVERDLSNLGSIQQNGSSSRTA